MLKAHGSKGSEYLILALLYGHELSAFDTTRYRDYSQKLHGCDNLSKGAQRDYCVGFQKSVTQIVSCALK